MRRWWRRATVGERTSGRPTSSNRASSLHLRWIEVGDSVAAAVTLEVLTPPTVPELYFWALQVEIAGPVGTAAGAHLGLQWYPPHPGSTAVNWGGYRRGGGELPGSSSDLPSATGNPNTRDLRWHPGRRYRLSVERVDASAETGSAGASAETDSVATTAWRGCVTDLETSAAIVVRELYSPGDHIAGVVMWSEVFACCDDPATEVRWSEPSVTGADGVVRPVGSMSVNYQSVGDGGCSNTDSSTDGTGYVQRTCSERVTPQGAVLRVGRR